MDHTLLGLVLDFKCVDSDPRQMRNGSQDLSALVQVPPSYSFDGCPTYLDGTVVVGMGRGSKQMGVPTANLDPKPLADQLEELPKGVYFG